MNLERIIPEIHTITTGIYYKELQETLDYILEIPYKDRKGYLICCQEKIYRECKKIGKFFKIPVIIETALLDKNLIVIINVDKIKNDFTNYIF